MMSSAVIREENWGVSEKYCNLFIFHSEGKTQIKLLECCPENTNFTKNDIESGIFSDLKILWMKKQFK